MKYLACLLALLFVAKGLAAEFHAGFAEADITPPVGWRKGGGFNEVISTGVHDPLFAKAAVFRQGDTWVGLVICDLLGVPETWTTPTRWRMQERTGIPFSNIIITATHTHGGPEAYGPMWEHFHQREIAEKGQDGQAATDYIGQVQERMAQALARAKDQLAPVKLEILRAEQPGLAFNRRYHLHDGTVRFNPGKMNPEIDRVAGPTDPELPFLLFRQPADNRAVAGLSIFAMHVAVWGGAEFSADYPGHLARRLREHFGANFFPMFAQGTAGNINHINFLSPAPDPDSAAIGQKLGQTIIAALPKLAPVGEPNLAIRSTLVHAPLREITQEEIERSHAIMARTDRKPSAFLLQVDAWRILHNADYRQRFGETLPNEIQVIRLGADTALVSLPHEVFVELGQEIKRRSPFRHTLVMSMAQDVDFYIPTRQAYAEGGYEVHTTPLKPGVGEAFVEAALKLLRELADS